MHTSGRHTNVRPRPVDKFSPPSVENLEDPVKDQYKNEAKREDFEARRALRATRPLRECEHAALTLAGRHAVKKSTTPVLRLYIAPAILIAPVASIVASTELPLRMLATVISTFLRATASTNA
jgi:hypothetical protein